MLLCKLVIQYTTYSVRCSLSPAGYRHLDNILVRLNWLYNQALEERKTAYAERKETLRLYDQHKWLTGLRARNEQGLGEIALGPARGMLKRLDEAFQSFFRRVKAGQAPGFPRFRPLSRCVTIDLAQIRGGTVKPRGSHYELKAKGFPRIRLHASRELPAGIAKAVRLTKRGRHWEASLVYAVKRAALPASVKAVGIDLGVRKRMTLSNGKRYQRATRDWRRKRRLQRAVARCRKGSQRRRKRVRALARFQRREFVRERNACHRATTEIIREHGLVAVERLHVAKMTRSARGTEEQPGKHVAAKAGLNREILSQNWSLLRRQLEQKAEWAGREYMEVDPKYTSQDCSRCGARNNPRAAETYRCRACGLVEDRDVNAAINILAAGVIAAGASTWAVGPCVAPESYARAA
ncbi:MAG: transposase [Bryobacterales bacterium]|nr:transposase [Bryobacterales bacterium]